MLSRVAALGLATVFVVWLALTVREMAAHAGDAPPRPRRGGSLWRWGLVALAGVAMLWAAGDAIVAGASMLAERHGWDPFVVGATLVALGTTTPELATMIVSRLKGHDEVGAGTLLGSCMFNGGLIIPVAALITPIPTDLRDVAIPLGAGVVSILVLLSVRGPVAGRTHGALLVGCYLVYLALLAAGR